MENIFEIALESAYGNWNEPLLEASLGQKVMNAVRAFFEKVSKLFRTIIARVKNLFKGGKSSEDKSSDNKDASDELEKELEDLEKEVQQSKNKADKLFKEMQNPVKADVILTLTPTSDLATNRRKIQGVERIVLSAVDGLTKEYLNITDRQGIPLNDDDEMREIDRISVIDREQKTIQKLENYYRQQLLGFIQPIKGKKRVPDIQVKIDMNFSEKHVESTHYIPFVLKEDNPDTPYDDSEIKDSVVGSSQTVTREWQGTGFNPQGPTGQEGNNAAPYADMTNVIGRQIETGVTQNFLVNTDNISETVHPEIDRITVAVNVDGTWIKEFDKNHNVQFDEQGRIKRTYIPVPKEELEEREKHLFDYSDITDRIVNNLSNQMFDRVFDSDDFISAEERIKKADTARKHKEILDARKAESRRLLSYEAEAIDKLIKDAKWEDETVMEVNDLPIVDPITASDMPKYNKRK